jgi:hypothetical protein
MSEAGMAQMAGCWLGRNSSIRKKMTGADKKACKNDAEAQEKAAKAEAKAAYDKAKADAKAMKKS